MTWQNISENFPQTNLSELIQHFGCSIAYSHEDVFEINLSTQPTALRVRGRTYTLADDYWLVIVRDVPPMLPTERLEVVKPIRNTHSPLPYAKEIASELARAQKMHPDFPYRGMFYRQTVLAEESGEVAKAMLHYRDEGASLDEVREELIQTASSAIRLLLSLEDLPEYYSEDLCPGYFEE